MVVDYVEALLTTIKAPAGSAPLSVVFDMHNYQRWCPMGIGGTWSCLEEAADATGKIKYSADAASTSCPLSSAFPNHASFEGVCPKKQTPAQVRLQPSSLRRRVVARVCAVCCPVLTCR